MRVGDGAGAEYEIAEPVTCTESISLRRMPEAERAPGTMALARANATLTLAT